MIIGVGVDLVDASRFSLALSKSPKLRQRLFGDEDSSISTLSLAARFAAKEALVKALGTASGLTFMEILVVKDSNGKPHFSFIGNSQRTIEDAGVHALHLSLSHDGNMATAVVIAEAKS